MAPTRPIVRTDSSEVVGEDDQIRPSIRPFGQTGDPEGVRFSRMIIEESAFGRSATEGSSLRHVVEAVGSPTLQVASVAVGLDVWARGTVVLDPTEPLVRAPGALLLASGVRAGDPSSESLLRAASIAGFCAVIVKRRGEDLTSFVSDAQQRGLVVLVVADDVPWRHLDTLLTLALGSTTTYGAPGSPAGDELFALANAIAAVIGGSVAIEDLDRRVVAYSSLPNQRIDDVRERGILDRRVPDDEANPLQYRQVHAATGVVRFPQVVDELARSAIGIKAGSQPLGTIWAIEREGGLEADGEQALVEGALRAALVILRNSNTNALKLRLDETTLQQCFDGLISGSEAAFRLSLPRGCELVLLGFGLVRGDLGSNPLLPAVAGAIVRHVGAYRPDALVASTPTVVYLLLPGGGMAAAARFAAGATRALASEFHDHVRVAIGGASTDPSELSSMRREVDDILRVTTVHADLPHVARLHQVRARVILTRVADEFVHEPRLRHPGADAMCAYDREHGTSYAVTVTAWLDNIGDVSTAAACLQVHPNTLRYRLRRAGELFDIALDDPDDRLAVWLQLRVAWQTSRQNSDSG
jgi:hypothetical protein